MDTADSLKEEIRVLKDELIHSVEIQAFDRKTIAKLHEEKEADNAAYLTNMGIIEHQYKQELARLTAQLTKDKATKDKATISASTTQVAEHKELACYIGERTSKDTLRTALVEALYMSEEEHTANPPSDYVQSIIKNLRHVLDSEWYDGNADSIETHRTYEQRFGTLDKELFDEMLLRVSQKAEEEDAEDEENWGEISMEEMIKELQPAVVFKGVHAAD